MVILYPNSEMRYWVLGRLFGKTVDTYIVRYWTGDGYITRRVYSERWVKEYAESALN